MDSGSIDAWWWLTRMIMTGSARQWQGRRLNNGVQVQLISILHINTPATVHIFGLRGNGTVAVWQACRHSVPADIPSQANPMMVSCTMLSTCCTAATVSREARCNVWLRMDLALPTYYCLPVPIIWTPQLLFFFFPMHGQSDHARTHAICFYSWSTGMEYNCCDMLLLILIHARPARRKIKEDKKK